MAFSAFIVVDIPTRAVDMPSTMTSCCLLGCYIVRHITDTGVIKKSQG